MRPSLVEMMVMNEEPIQGCGQHGDRRGWRMYRIEYGFECSCPEGVIFLPPGVSPEKVEALFGETEHEPED